MKKMEDVHLVVLLLWTDSKDPFWTKTVFSSKGTVLYWKIDCSPALGVSTGPHWPESRPITREVVISLLIWLVRINDLRDL